MATNDKMKRLFSQRLVGVMQENNINQVELSKILGVSESTVGKWILCKAIPRMGVIQKLSDYFHVGKSYFLEEMGHIRYWLMSTNRRINRLVVLCTSCRILTMTISLVSYKLAS